MDKIDKEKPQTNADRIRSMTDEELALSITCPAEYDLNFNKNEKCNGEMNKNCYECSLKWLQEEIEVIGNMIDNPELLEV